MFPNDGSIQIEGGRFDGAGDFSAPFTDPSKDKDNLWESKKALLLNNRGEKAKNTLIGAFWGLTTELVTPINISTETKILGTTTFDYDVHFSKNAENSIRNNTAFSEIVKVDGYLIIKGTQGDSLTVILKKRVNATGLYETVSEFPTTVNNFAGSGDDVALLTVFRPFVEFDTEDDLELWIINNSSNNDITLLIGSYLAVHK